MSQLHSSPSTPSGSTRSNTLLGKVFQKLRTPNGSSGSRGAAASASSSSSPGAANLKRASSRSSFQCVGQQPPGHSPSNTGGGMMSRIVASLSTSSLHSTLSNTSSNRIAMTDNDEDDEDEDELQVPVFESDVLKSWAQTHGQQQRAPSPQSQPHATTLTQTTTTRSASAMSNHRRTSPADTASSSLARPTMRAATADSGVGGVDSLGRINTSSSSSTASYTRRQHQHHHHQHARAITDDEAESLINGTAADELAFKASATAATAQTAESFKSPANLDGSLSSRPTLHHLSSNDRVAGSSTSSNGAPAALTDAVTPGVRAKDWLSRTARSGTGEPRKVARRAQRAAPLPPPSSFNIGEQQSSPNDADQSQQGTSPDSVPRTTTRPPASPLSHGRSRSDVPPSSPRLDGAQPAERGAATVTIGSTAQLRRKPSIDLVAARPGSSLSRRPSDSDSSSPAEWSKRNGPLFNSLGCQRSSQIHAHAHPQTSAALRQRMLYSSTSSSLAATELSGSGTTPPSVTAAPISRLPSSVSSVSGSDVSPASLDRGANSFDLRRSQQPSSAESSTSASLSHRSSLDDRKSSPQMIPYAKRTASSSSSSSTTARQQPLDVDFASLRSSANGGGSSSSLSRSNSISRDQESTITARPASSLAVYHDEPQEQAPPRSAYGRNLASSTSSTLGSSLLHDARPTAVESLPPRAASAMAMYHDENEYRADNGLNSSLSSRHGSRTVQAMAVSAGVSGGHNVPSGGGRMPLAETFRANPQVPAQDSLAQQQQQHQQQLMNGYPKDFRQPSPGSMQQQLQQQQQQSQSRQQPQPQHLQQQQRMAVAMATPSMTAQPHHYVGQQLQQQQQQQQAYMNGMMPPGYPNPHQTPMDYQVPIQKPVKKGQSVIIVNGKAYARAGILGKGGSSRVYRVLDEKNNLFAIKKVDISKNDAESRASFINEIHLLEKLRGNPQIIRLVDSEINDQKKVLLMVMEVGETDLNNLLIEHSGKPISMNFIRYIWEQMLEAVHCLHNENVVHTDLKPANFVLVKGRLKLIDFGISKAIANDTTNIGREQQIGTANYMPPEALIDSGLGRDGKRLMKLGRAADVWSLGCILHQMVYGRTPFAHIRDVSHKMMTIQNPRHVIQFADFSCPIDERGQPVKDFEVKVDREVKETMKSCLRFNQKERMTIPELLAAPFLRGEGRVVNEDVVEVKKSDLPTIDHATMNVLIQRVTRMVTGKPLAADDGKSIAEKLMNELRAAQSL
ncbi:hypothetical protein ACM66B_003511 [Microbotryomycetes sp. NB124-2]